MYSALISIRHDYKPHTHIHHNRSSDFRPCYGCICDLRAYAPPGTPMLAATATVTEKMRRQIVGTLDMRGCEFVNVSPNKPNIFYSMEKKKWICDIEAKTCRFSV